jgi:hypothetical protein
MISNFVVLEISVEVFDPKSWHSIDTAYQVLFENQMWIEMSKLITPSELITEGGAVWLQLDSSCVYVSNSELLKCRRIKIGSTRPPINYTSIDNTAKKYAEKVTKLMLPNTYQLCQLVYELKEFWGFVYDIDLTP